MLVGSTNEDDIPSRQPLVPTIHVGWQVSTGNVANVQWAVGIRQSRGDEDAFEVSHITLVVEARKYGNHEPPTRNPSGLRILLSPIGERLAVERPGHGQDTVKVIDLMLEKLR